MLAQCGWGFGAPQPNPFGKRLCADTWQAVDQPAELLLGYVGPAEVQRHGLPADDPAEHEWRDGGAAVQVDARPQSLVTTPAGRSQTL